MLFTAVVLCTILVGWLLFNGPQKPIHQELEELREANATMKIGLDSLMTAYLSDTPHIYDGCCQNIITTMKSWDMPHVLEVRNWLVSQGFWRAEVAGIPVYTNGRHTWRATARKNSMLYSSFSLECTSKRKYRVCLGRIDSSDTIKEMQGEMKR